MNTLEEPPIFAPLPATRPGFPQVARFASSYAGSSRSRFKPRGPNSPASRSSLKLIVKTTHSTCALMASRAGSWKQSSHGQDTISQALIEAEAEKALDLLRGRECPPLPVSEAGSQIV